PPAPWPPRPGISWCIWLSCVSLLCGAIPGAGSTREAPGGKPRVGLIQDHRDDDRAPDDDPFVVLVEVQRADRLADQHDEQRAEHRVDGAAPAAGEARAPHDRGRYHVKLVAGRVDAR